MDIEELKKTWETDSYIGEDLGAAAIQGSSLHSKYLNILINAKLRLTKVEHEIAELKATKSKYFRGEMTKEELTEKGWKQWQYKTLKSDIGELIDADADFQKYAARQSYIKNIIYFLESVLGAIKNRNFEIRAAIDWQKWRAGG